MRISRRSIEEQLRSVADPEEPRGATSADMAWKGIELCRRDDWKEGLYWLTLAAGAREGADDLPALFYSYLGYGVARYQKQQQQGLKLCRRAIELEFYQPESFDFLARTHLLMGNRRAAYDVVERGFEVDSSHEGLLALRSELGERRPPVLPFLPRSHTLNRWLGKTRHRLLGRHKVGGGSGG